MHVDYVDDNFQSVIPKVPKSQFDTLELSHPHGRHQGKSDSARVVCMTDLAGLCQRSRCSEYGAVWYDGQRVARCPPES